MKWEVYDRKRKGKWKEKFASSPQKAVCSKQPFAGNANQEYSKKHIQEKVCEKVIRSL